MRRFLNLVIILFIFGHGCSWLGIHKSRETLPESANPYISKSSKIVDKALLKKGGKVAIIPFVAGPNVEANDELDKISLMIVKGLAEELGVSGVFEIVTGEAAKEADFILDGRITSIGKTPSWEKVATASLKNNVKLAVQGRIVTVTSKDLVLVFSDDRSGRQNQQTHQQLGLSLGQDIGKFILRGIEE